MPRWSNGIGDDGQFETEFGGFDVGPGAPREDLRAGLAIVARTCAPGAPRIIGEELQRMRALTKSRAEPGVDANFQAVAMFNEMRGYPADVVVDACRKWSAAEKFFPSWAEVKDMLDRRMRERLALKRAIERALTTAPQAASEEPVIDLTERRKMGEMLGDLAKQLGGGTRPEPAQPQPRADPAVVRRVMEETRAMRLVPRGDGAEAESA